jgi:hypothetical protein
MSSKVPIVTEDAVPEVHCEKCNQFKPWTPKFFPRFRGGTTALQKVCRSCKRKQRQRQKLDRMERDFLGKSLGLVSRGGPNVPHTAEALESVLNYFGGTNGLSSIMLKQYYDSPPGSRMRTTILEMIFRLINKNTEQGGAKKPVSLLTEEELEEDINKRISHLIEMGGYGAQKAQDATARIAAITDSGDVFGLPEGRVENPTVGVDAEANGVPEALQAKRKAMGVPPEPSE